MRQNASIKVGGMMNPGYKRALVLSLSLLLLSPNAALAMTDAAPNSGADASFQSGGESQTAPAGTLLLPMIPKIDTQAPAVRKGEIEEGSEPSASPPAKTKPVDLDKEISSKEQELIDDLGMPASLDDPKVDNKFEANVQLKGNVQITADDTEYDDNANTFLGTGNAEAVIGGQNSTLSADTILYNQDTDIIDARGNVRIIRNGELTTGSAFKFNVTSEEYLITNPNASIDGTVVISRTARATKSGVNFSQGTMQLPHAAYIQNTVMTGPISYREQAMSKAMHPDAYVHNTGSYKFTARKMVYEKYRDADNLTIFGGEMKFGDFCIPLPKFVTTIGKQDTRIVFPITPVLGSNLQVGGFNLGPSFNYGIGKTGKVSWAPLLQIGGRTLDGQGGGATNNASSIGIGGRASYSSRKLSANIAYGSVSNLMVADLKYRIRKGFKFQAGINRFLDDGMMGSNRARQKYELVDNHMFQHVPYLGYLNFRSSYGWMQDDPNLINLSPQYAKLFGKVTQTAMNTAWKAQEQITASSHPLFNIGDDKYGVKGYLTGGLAFRGYSTSQATAIGQWGPQFDVHLNRVRLLLGYTKAAFRGSSPFVFDQYIYGTRSFNIGGDYRISKYLTVGGAYGYNLDLNLPTQETISAAVGPNDMKLVASYDYVRGIARTGFDLVIGQPMAFNKLVIKNNPDRGMLGGI